MFNLFTLLTLIVSTMQFSAIANTDQNTCPAHIDFLKASVANSSPIPDFIKTLGHSKINLLAIGETHLNPGKDQEYEKIVRILSNYFPKPFCVFQEMPMFPNEKGNMTGNFNYLIKNYHRLMKSKNKNLKKEWAAKFSNYNFSFTDSDGMKHSDKYLKFSVDHGIKVFFIDLPEKIRGEIPVDSYEKLLWMNNRDAFMANNVIAAYQSGKCASGILVTGRHHLTSSDPKRITFRTHLMSSKRINPYFITTLDADYSIDNFSGSYKVNDHAWNWINRSYQPECKMFPGYPGANFAFPINKSRWRNLSLDFGSFWENGDDLGYWQDFDAGMVFKSVQAAEKGLIFN